MYALECRGIPWDVTYLLHLNAIMNEKGVKFYVSLLLQNELIMLVADFSWHFNETCAIKLVNVKTTRMVTYPPLQ